MLGGLSVLRKKYFYFPSQNIPWTRSPSASLRLEASSSVTATPDPEQTPTRRRNRGLVRCYFTLDLGKTKKYNVNTKYCYNLWHFPLPRIRGLSKHFSGVQRSQSEKSKDKQTFLAQKAQLPKKAAGGPLPTKATTEAVEIPGLYFIFLLFLFCCCCCCCCWWWWWWYCCYHYWSWCPMKATTEAVEIPGLRCVQRKLHTYFITSF